MCAGVSSSNCSSPSCSQAVHGPGQQHNTTHSTHNGTHHRQPPLTTWETAKSFNSHVSLMVDLQNRFGHVTQRHVQRAPLRRSTTHPFLSLRVKVPPQPRDFAVKYLNKPMTGDTHPQPRQTTVTRTTTTAHAHCQPGHTHPCFHAPCRAPRCFLRRSSGPSTKTGTSSVAWPPPEAMAAHQPTRRRHAPEKEGASHAHHEGTPSTDNRITIIYATRVSWCGYLQAPSYFAWEDTQLRKLGETWPSCMAELPAGHPPNLGRIWLP